MKRVAMTRAAASMAGAMANLWKAWCPRSRGGAFGRVFSKGMDFASVSRSIDLLARETVGFAVSCVGWQRRDDFRATAAEHRWRLDRGPRNTRGPLGEAPVSRGGWVQMSDM